MASTAQKNLEWPHGPERNQRHKMLVFANHPLTGSALQLDVVAQQATAVALLVVGQCGLLFPWFVGNRIVGPDLPVRMRIAASHHLATVLEDLHVIDLGHCS